MSFKVNSTKENNWAYGFNQVVEMQQEERLDLIPDADPVDSEELRRRPKVARELFPTEASTRRDGVKAALDETEATIVVKSDEQREQEEKRRLANAKYSSQITVFKKV